MREVRDIGGDEGEPRCAISEAATAIPCASMPLADFVGIIPGFDLLEGTLDRPLEGVEAKGEEVFLVTVCGFISEPRCGARWNRS